MSDYSHLWNDLPFDERKRLMPHQIETQILHLEQMRVLAVKAHNRHLLEIDNWIANCKLSLAEAVAETTPQPVPR